MRLSGFHLPLLVALKMEEGAMSPRLWAPLGAGKEEVDSSLRASCCHLDFSLVRPLCSDYGTTGF